MFTNPIVGGTTLIRPAIQSPNYVVATSGWSINIDGSAEFNNVVIRGTLNVTGPSTLGGTLTMTGGACILTAASPAQRISICSTPQNRIQFFSGLAGEVTPAYIQVTTSGTQGILGITSPDFGLGSFAMQFMADGTNGASAQINWSGGGFMSMGFGGGFNVSATTVTGNLEVISGDGYIGTNSVHTIGAVVGRSAAYGLNVYAEFRHAAIASANYALLHSNVGETFVNASPGHTGHLRINNADIVMWQSNGVGIGNGSSAPSVVGNIPLTLTSNNDQLWLNSTNYINTILSVGNGKGIRFWDQTNGEIMNFNRGGAQADCRIPAFPSFATTNAGMSNVSGELCVNTSSARIKENIVDLPSHESGAANPIWKLHARRFRLREGVQHAEHYNSRNPDGYGIAGLIAEEIDELIPHAAFVDGRSPENGGQGGIISWDERALIAYLIDAVQHLKRSIDGTTGVVPR